MKSIIIRIVILAILIFLSILLSGCDNNIYNNADKEAAEAAAIWVLESRHFRDFYIEETILDKETMEFEVLARSADGEMTGSVIIYVDENGQVIIRSREYSYN